VLGAWRKTREAFHVPFFPCGDEAEQVAIGLGAEGFSAVTVIMEKTGGKGARHMLAVFGFQFVERSQRNAVSAVEMAEGFKDFGLELVVWAARWFGLRLRRWIGAYSFMNSHVASCLGDLVRARSVFQHRALPVTV
jgi:hypothetical protein